VNDLRYPVVGLIDRNSRLSAYVAWDRRDLESCPLHDYLRTKRAKHTLVDADGNTYKVRVARLAGVDWQRVRAIGIVVQAISAILSLGNIPVRIDQGHEKTEPLALGEVKEFLFQALEQRPSPYTARKSEKTVRASVSKARTFGEVAAAISSVAPQ
jgi:hypothetical protein